MIHNYNNHYKKFEKNLILGEGSRVFAVGGPDDEDNQNQTDADLAEAKAKAEAGNTKESSDSLHVLNEKEALEFETEENKKLRALLPGPNQTYFEPGQELDTYLRQWNLLLTDYNGYQNHIDNFDRLLNRLKKPDVPDDVSEDMRWIVKVDKLFNDFEKMYEAMGSGAKRGRFQLSKESISRMRTQRREEIIAAIEKIKQDFMGPKMEAEIALKAQMEKDFGLRLDAMQKTWEKNTPEGFEDKKSVHLRYINDHRKRLKKLNKDMPFTEYVAIHQALANMEGIYKYAESARSGDISIPDLEKRYVEVKAYKEEKVDAVTDKFAELAGKTTQKIDALIDAINYANAKEEVKEERIKELNKLKDNVSKYADIGGLFGDMLENEEFFRDKDGKKIPITGRDPSKENSIQQGLKYQLEYLKSHIPPEGDMKSLAIGLSEAFDHYQSLIDETVDSGEAQMQIIMQEMDTNIALLKNEAQGSDAMYKWHFLSISNLKRGAEIVKEWAIRRFTRDENLRVGKAGSKLLGPLANVPYLKTLPNDFDRQVENSEKEEVQGYKDIYSNKDAWQVLEIARTTPNKDELKACLYLLTDLGRLRWDDVQLLKQFNAFQSSVEFNTDDIMVETRNMSRFMDKLRRTIGALWDFDTFNSMYNANNSGYESKKQEYKAKMDALAEYSGGLSNHASQLLSDFKAKGEAAKVNPIEYEMIIDYSIKNGKMGAEEKLYFLIQGMGCGLLSPDRGSALNSIYINQYPVIDVFGSQTKRGPKPNLKDVREIAAFDWDLNKPGPMFKKWFHTHAMRLPRVTQRIDKALTQGLSLDHDDSTAFLAYLNDATTATILQKQATGYTMPLTGIQNMTVAMQFWMDNAAYNEYDSDLEKRQDLVRFVSSFVTFDAIASDRMYHGRDYFRWGTSGAYDSKPRSDQNYTDSFGREDMTARNYMDKTKSFIRELDPEFFDPVLTGKIRTPEDVKTLVNSLQAKYPGKRIFGDMTGNINSVDDLYKSAGAYTKFLLDENPAVASKMFSKVREDQSQIFAKRKKAGKKSVIDFEKAHKENLRKAQAATGLNPPGQGSPNNLWYIGDDVDGRTAT